jgi:hypothetical protein
MRATDVVAPGPRAQRAAHAVRQLDQQAVAGVVAEAVVDRLEVIEVEVAHRQQRAFAAARLHRGLQHCASRTRFGRRVSSSKWAWRCNCSSCGACG